VATVTSASKIGLTWDPPSFNGGSPILDYRIWTDNGSISQFVVLAEANVLNEYTMTGTTQGMNYRFFV